MNFFLNVPQLKNDVINYMNTKFSEFKENKLTSLDLFSDYNFYNVMFAFNYSYDCLNNSNVQIDVKNFLQHTELDFHLNLMINHQKSEEYFYFYFHSKFAYAKFIFTMLFENTLKKFNLLDFKLVEILNLNIFQRYLYMINSKNFCQLSLPNDINEIENLFKSIDTFTENLFTLMKHAIQYYQDHIPLVIYEIFFKLCKNLTKRNLLTNKIEYVKILIEIINKDLSKLQDDDRKYQSYLYAIKSLFYIILYENDEKIIKNLRKNKGHSQMQEKEILYIYQCDENSEVENMIKCFMLYSFGDYKEDESSKIHIKNLKVYYTKMMDILVGKNEFYTKNILNMRFISNDYLKYFIETEKEDKEFVLGLRDIIQEDKESREFYEDINKISQNLIRVNNEYFSNTNGDIQELNNIYEVKIDSVLTEIRKLINDKFDSIPPLNKNYLTVLHSELGDEKNRRKLQKMKEVVKFSNFFQALDGYFLIISQNKTQLRINSKMTENKTALLFFLYLLIKDDYQNLMLMLSIFNPKNLVITFEETQPYFYNFLEGVMDALFGLLPEAGAEANAKFYFFDNYYFYVNVILELLNLSLNILPNSLNDSKILNHIHNCFKLSRKSLKFFKWGDSSIVELTENLVKSIPNHFGQILKPNLELFLQSYNTNKLDFYMKQILEKIIKHYFMFQNEILESDFKFFGIIYENDFGLFSLPQIKEYLNNHNLPLIIRMEMQEFYNNSLFSNNFKSSDSKISKFYRLEPKYYDNRFFRELNFKIPYLCGKVDATDIKEQQPEEKFIKSLDESCKYFIESTLKNINEVFNQSYEINPITRRKIALFKYYEKAIVYPTYTIINNYLTYGSLLKGKSMYVIYQLVFEFMKATYNFYEKILLKPIVKDDIIDINEYEKFPVNKLETFLIDVNPKDNSFLEKLKDYIKDFSDNTITYIETEKVCGIFDTILKYILPKVKKSDGGKIMLFKKLVEQFVDLEINPLHQKIEDLYLNYKSRIKSCKPENKLIVKIMTEKNENRLYDNLVENIIRNFISIGDTGEYDSLLVFKTQYLSIYQILNNLCKHDYKIFQDSFYKILPVDSYYAIQFKRLNENFYMPSMVAECKKNLELERKSIDNITFKLSKNIIKLLQNLCEGHNRDFQNFLFKQKLDYYWEIRSMYKRNEGYEDFVPQIKEFMNTNLDRNNYAFQKFDEICDYSYLCYPKLFNIRNDEILKISDRELIEYYVAQYNALWMTQHSLPSFIFLFLKMLISNSNFPNLSSNLLLSKKKIRPTKNIEKLIIYNTNLIVEMIQGCDTIKINQISYKFPSYTQRNIEIGKESFDLYEEFFFLSKYFKEMRKLFLTNKLIIQEDTIEVKLSLFYLIKTLMNQVEKEQMEAISIIMLKQFPLNSLLNCVILYLKMIYFKYIYPYESDQIIEDENEFIEKFQLTLDSVDNLLIQYKEVKEIFNFQMFKLAADIFLCITVFADKFKNPEAKQIKELYNPNQDLTKRTSGGEETKILEEKIAAVKFFNKLILQCEFLIPDNNYTSKDYFTDATTEIVGFEEYKVLTESKGNDGVSVGGESKVKKIYFVANPSCYDISIEKIEQFFDNVDRSTINTKLKGLLEEINLMQLEVSYKEKMNKMHEKKKNSSNVIDSGKMSKEMLNFEYKNMDIFNFRMSFLINLILLISVKDKNIYGEWFYYAIILLSIYQIYYNIYYLYVYFKSRFNYSILVEKERLGLTDKEKLTLAEKFEVYVKRSIFSEEIYLFYFNILICLSCIIDPNAFVLFPLQLLNAIKFVSAIKQMVMAFQMKYHQFLAMIGFLAILIFTYSIMGFYFMKSEFILQFDNGVNGNACKSLLSCFVLYFNFGIRSGGGIGDVTGMRPYNGSIFFWFKWIMDMIFYITVILLIMNMVNGIIISTFSQIREEEENKNQDIKDVCFICSRKRIQFEKKKKSFQQHLLSEHNQEYYIYFFVTLVQIKETDMNSDQSYIYESFRNKEINFFPVEKTMYLETYDNEQEDDEDESE